MPSLEIERDRIYSLTITASNKEEVDPSFYPPVGGFEDTLARSDIYRDNEEESPLDSIPADLPEAIKRIREEIRNRSPTRR